MIVVALLNKFETRRTRRRLSGIEAKTEIVREQVQNSHRTNLRDDHDRVRDGVETLARRFDTFAAATRSADLRIERKVDGLSKRLDAHIDGTTD